MLFFFFYARILVLRAECVAFPWCSWCGVESEIVVDG